MRLVICPGVHEPKLTDCFLTGLSDLWGLAADRQNQQIVEPVKIFPAHKYPPFSALDILHFLWREELAGESLVFVSFSAGVAGAIGAAWMWQQLGGKVGAFFALDGWGVPLGAIFPSTESATIALRTGVQQFSVAVEKVFMQIRRPNIWIYGELPKRQKAGTSAKPPPALRLSHPQPQQNF